MCSACMQAKNYHERYGTRLTIRKGFCGLFGEVHDAMEFHWGEMVKLEDQIRKERARALEEDATPSW